MATVKDIAKLAGVSTATVSRALANPKKVTDATKLKVQSAADQLGYAPNAIARSLRTQESKTIVVILPDIGNHFFTDIIKGIEQIAHKNAYKVLIGDAGNDVDRATKYLELVYSKQADGVLSLTADIPIANLLDASGKPKFPLVMACEYYPQSAIPSVHIDNEYSARIVLESLVQMGHYKIACITGDRRNSISIARMKGFKDSMKKWRLQIPDQYIAEGDYSLLSGYELAAGLLSLEDRPSAIFCHNDEMAIGVLKRAREMDIKVPEQLSVVGFDNIPFCEYSTPELSTVHQPKQLIGETAMKLLLNILSGKKPNPEITLPTQLIVRGTTMPPPLDQRLKIDI
ncbi:MAG: LacI family transcriptional regulator [Pseudomonadales bacterium]|nr:LacI family transcriptional regulator [Pseudomonadales bacterium]NRA18308.1 LacI family DNA-binding transcriptional regulator [Oceanospirillaceae bacterium]